MRILVHNLQEGTKIDKQYIKEVVKKTLKFDSLTFNFEGTEYMEINVVFVDNKYIKRLNGKYLNRNYPTDVMAFSIKEEEMFGDIFVSVEQAKEQAREQKHTLKKELTLLVIHGILHLLGYNHLGEKESFTMRQTEEEILRTCLK